MPKGLWTVLNVDPDSEDLDATGPEVLHFYRALRWYDSASPWTTTEAAGVQRIPWHFCPTCGWWSL